MAPSDFSLFPKLKEVMKGYNLKTIIGIKTESSHVIKEILVEDYQACVHAWKQRMHKRICADEYYFEGDHIDVDDN